MLKFDPKPAKPVNHEQFEVFAEGLGRYSIDVSLPEGYGKDGTRYPMILVTDGNFLFDLVHAHVNGSHAAGNMLPKSIVVGVGYPKDEGEASFYARRNFDFHGDWAMTDDQGQMLHSIFNNLKQAEGKADLQMKSGGFPRFLAFLRDELIPSLSQSYAIDANARHTLIGDSSGGHFVLRALYDPGSPFRKYLCISPGFGSAAGTIQKAEADYASTHDDLDAELFICCGREEIDQGAMWARCRFGSGIVWIAEQFALRQWPKARIEWEIMNNEDHQSIPPRAIASGLRSVNSRRPGIHTAQIAEAINAMLKPAAQKT